MAHFHHFSICNQQFPQFLAKYLGYSLTFWPNMAHFHHFSICNQNQSISFGHFLAKYQDYSLTFWPNMAHCQNQSINVKFGHFFAKYQGYSLTLFKAIALLFWLMLMTFQSAIKITQIVKFPQFLAKYLGTFCQTWLIFITFQSAIKINQFQIWSFFGKIPRL